MSLTLEPLQPKDMAAYLQVQWDAFEPLSANTIYPMMYPNGFQPDVQARMGARLIETFEEGSHSHCFCARDSSTNEIVGVSWWMTVSNGPQTKAEMDAEFEQMHEARMRRPPVVGSNDALEAAFFHAIFYSQREIMMEQDYLLVRLLATSPRHQGRGVGSFLLRAALEEADRRGLPTFIHGTVGGKPLYEKFGFEVVGLMPFNGLDYGGRSDGKHWCMVRPAAKAKPEGAQ